MDEGQYVDIVLDNIALPVHNRIYAVVDPGNTINECNKENNSMNIPAIASQLNGSITVSTDTLNYSANQLVTLQGISTNLGKLEANLTAQLILEDLNGNIIQAFDKQPLGIVSSQESRTISNEWNTTTTLAGEYVVHGILTDSDDNVVDESNSTFNIVSEQVDNVLATLDLRLDKATYHISDMVQLDNYVRSLSSNSMIKHSFIQIEVSNSSQQVIHTQTLKLGTLLPESRRDIDGIYSFVHLAVGNYKVKATLKDDNNISYATDMQTFKVEENLDIGLKGSVNLAWREAYIGSKQTCNYSVSNLGSSILNNLPLAVKIVDMDDGATEENYQKNITLIPLNTEAKSKLIDTKSYQARTYSCGLYAKVDSQWLLLDHKLFTLKYLQAPKAYNDYKNVVHGASVVVNILFNDSVIKNNLDLSTLRIIDTKGHAVRTLVVPHQGRWSILSDGQIRFVPQENYIGDPTPVTYQIEDYTGVMLSARIYLNYPPVAYADSAKTVFGKSVEIAVLHNDKKTSSVLDIKRIRLIDAQQKEQNILSTDKGFWQIDSHKGMIRFTPKKDVEGHDSIVYVVYDKEGDKTNKATVSVQISKAIKPPPVVHPPTCTCGCGCQPIIPTPTPIPQPSPGPLVAPVVETHSATIHWQDKTYDEIGYMIYRDGVLIAVVDEDITTLNVEGLESNTQYAFEIVSFDGYGNHTKQFINIQTTLGMGWFAAVLHTLLD